MNLDLNKLVHNVSKVTLKGGIFAKTCTVIISIAIILFAICWLSKDIWIMRFSVLAITVIAFVMLSKLISFANKNPQAAILEGAEFLQHEQIQMAAKGIPYIEQDVRRFAEGKSINATADEIKQADTPDSTTDDLM